MFGPDYLVAPQLVENATQRSVYLPPLPHPEVWQNVFTQAQHAGGVVITEPPLKGEDYGMFPVYHRVHEVKR